ncbi:uncharacterized protein LOC135399242 [Ornithodoros turicata]|uniref:uncharacterized protein LOC135399242 n=1 Tax=Ornithodoros turicata TaxID=34597 RepID=UPI003138DA9F
MASSVYHCLLLFLVALLSVPTSRANVSSEPAPQNAAQRSGVYRDCGGILKESRGVITTPGFPGPYPVPIHCRWAIEAPPRQKVVLYLTQFYMKEGVSLSEYIYYSDDHLNIGYTEIGTVSSDTEPTYVMSIKPVLVIDFQVREMGNIHMRVLDLFLNVYGFNITYEMVDANATHRMDPCLGHHCSFNGLCLAAADLQSYRCFCLEDYYGDECQYSPRCGPTMPVSRCRNGGTCRYYIGTMTQTCACPPEFRGAHCEEPISVDHLSALQGRSSSPPSDWNSVATSECGQLNCSQKCSLGPNNHYRCECNPSFRMADDGRTCQPGSRTRFLVDLKLYDRNVDLDHMDAKGRTALQLGLENKLRNLFASRMESMETLAVLDFLPGAVVQFHFFAHKDESEIAKSIIEEALKTGKIGDYTVDRNFIRFEWEPAMNIESIESGQPHTRLGDELVVACITLGSSALKVLWFKDGFPVDPTTPFRSLWTTLVPKNSRDQYTALLGIDRTTVYDSGVFTCQVSDWGAVQNKSMIVRIDSAPRPVVTPAALTLTEGQELVLSCRSLNDLNRSLGYSWLKNDRVLRGPFWDNERVEDLYPSGSRLLLATVRSSATYACVVTGPAGSARREARVTVLAKDRKIPICPQDESLGVHWQPTAANSYDLQLCPKPYVDGDVKRHCVLSTDRRAVWATPDFSGCTDGELSRIKTLFDSLRMGYLMTTVPLVLGDLQRYLLSRKFQPGEGEPIVYLLQRILEYQKNPGLQLDPRDISKASKTFWDIASHLLVHKDLLQKQAFLTMLQKHVLEYSLLHASVTKPGTFEAVDRPGLVIEVGNLKKDPEQNGSTVRFPVALTARYVVSRESVRPAEAWGGNSVEVTLDSNAGTLVNGTVNVVAVLYKTLPDLLPERFLTRNHDTDYVNQLYSSLVGVAACIGHSAFNGSVRTKVKLVHSRPEEEVKTDLNITCGLADTLQSKIQFVTEGCVTSNGLNSTTCDCTRLGTYALLLPSRAHQAELVMEQQTDTIAGIGCGVCLCFLLLTLISLLLCWRPICFRQGNAPTDAIKMQVCIALIGAHAAMLKGVHGSLSQYYYPHLVSVIQFFLLAASCMQLCLGLAVYIEFVDTKNIRYPTTKIAAMGWAVPVIVVGANLAAQVLEGFQLDSWWLTLRTPSGGISNYFCAYVSSVIIITLLHFLLFLTVKAELRRYSCAETSKAKDAENRAGLLNRSMVIMLALIGVSFSSILYVNIEDVMKSYFFAGTCVFLGFLVFFLYTINSENRSLFCSAHGTRKDGKLTIDRNCQGNSCNKSYVKTAIVMDSAVSAACKSPVTAKSRTDGGVRRMPNPVPIPYHEEMDRLLKKKPSSSPGAGATTSTVCSEEGEAHADETTSLKSWRTRHQAGFELQQLEGSPRSSHPLMQEEDEEPPQLDSANTQEVTPEVAFSVTAV